MCLYPYSAYPSFTNALPGSVHFPFLLRESPPLCTFDEASGTDIHYVGLGISNIGILAKVIARVQNSLSGAGSGNDHHNQWPNLTASQRDSGSGGPLLVPVKMSS